MPYDLETFEADVMRVRIVLCGLIDWKFGHGISSITFHFSLHSSNVFLSSRYVISKICLFSKIFFTFTVMLVIWFVMISSRVETKNFVCSWIFKYTENVRNFRGKPCAYRNISGLSHYWFKSFGFFFVCVCDWLT